MKALPLIFFGILLSIPALAESTVIVDPPIDIDPCSLLTKDEAESLFGSHTTLGSRKAQNKDILRDPQKTTVSCEWVRPEGNLYVVAIKLVVGDRSTFQDRRGKVERVNLGEKAYFYSKLGQPILRIKQGRYAFELHGEKAMALSAAKRILQHSKTAPSLQSQQLTLAHLNGPNIKLCDIFDSNTIARHIQAKSILRLSREHYSLQTPGHLACTWFGDNNIVLNLSISVRDKNNHAAIASHKGAVIGDTTSLVFDQNGKYESVISFYKNFEVAVKLTQFPGHTGPFANKETLVELNQQVIKKL